jgi:uncharacterized membrane protein YedE/YeeE
MRASGYSPDMHHLLAHRPPWFVLGACLGLVTVGIAATLNERIGVLGGFSDVLDRAAGRTRTLGWKTWFLLGVLGGGVAFSALSGRWAGSGYGWLGHHVGSAWLGLPLVGAGILIGFGAKTAGGCTSGNGLGGCSAGSPAGVVSTATFMATAVAATFLLRWLVG